MAQKCCRIQDLLEFPSCVIKNLKPRATQCSDTPYMEMQLVKEEFDFIFI